MVCTVCVWCCVYVVCGLWYASVTSLFQIKRAEIPKEKILGVIYLTINMLNIASALTSMRKKNPWCRSCELKAGNQTQISISTNST